jgi:hypothetical protein
VSSATLGGRKRRERRAEDFFDELAEFINGVVNGDADAPTAAQLVADRCLLIARLNGKDAKESQQLAADLAAFAGKQLHQHASRAVAAAGLWGELHGIIDKGRATGLRLREIAKLDPEKHGNIVMLAVEQLRRRKLAKGKRRRVMVPVVETPQEWKH